MTCTSSSSSNISSVSLLTISLSHSTLLSSFFITLSNHPIGSIHSEPELLHQIIQLDQSTSNPNPPSPKFEIYPNPRSAETNFLQCSYISLSIFLFFFSIIFWCFFLPFTSRNHKKQLEIFKIFKGCF